MMFLSDLRRRISSAAAVAKAELRRLIEDIDAADAAEPVVASAPAANPWESPTYHLEVLKSSVCPTCSEPKDTGSYFCGRCASAKRATA